MKLVFYGLIAMLVAGILRLIVTNLDQSPSPAASKLSAPIAEPIPDRDNAWLYLVGIHAPDGVDPIAWGRSIVENSHLSSRSADTIPESATAASIALSFLDNDERADTQHARCPEMGINCIEWMADRGGHDARAWVIANRQLLDRYEIAQSFSDFQEPLDFRGMDIRLTDTVNLESLVRAQIASDFVENRDFQRAVNRSLHSVSFWKMVHERGHTEQSRMLSGEMVVGHQELTAQLMDHASVDDLESEVALIEAVLAPLTQSPESIRALVAHNYQYAANLFNTEKFRSHASETCRSGSMPDCWNSRIETALLQQQAVHNILAILALESEKVIGAPAPGYADALRQWDHRQSELVAAQDSNFFSQTHYRLTGQLAASISGSRPDWPLALHDHETARRMIWVKWQALRSKVRPENMGTFIASRSMAERNPYNGSPFEWDPLRQQVRAKARYPQHAGVLTTNYRPRDPSGVAEYCPWPIKLTFDATGPSTDVLFHSADVCGDHLIASAESRNSLDNSDGVGPWLDIHSVGESMNVTIVYPNGGSYRIYRSTPFSMRSRQSVELLNAMHESVTSEIRLSTTPLDGEHYMLNVENMANATAAQLLAEASSKAPAGLDLLTDEPVTLQLTAELSFLYGLLGQMAAVEYVESMGEQGAFLQYNGGD